MQRIVIAEFMDQSAVSNLALGFDVDYLPESDGSLADLIPDAQALIVRNKTQVNEALLNAAPQLQVVGRLGVGLDNIDLEACSQRNIRVIPATGANDNAVAEYVITSAMMLLRNAYHANRDVINGSWPRQDCMGYEVANKTIGLVGFGAIAQKTANKAQALDMQVMAYDPYIAPNDQVWHGITHKDNLSELLSEADIVSLHTPLTPATKNLIDAEAIAQMKDNAVLINSARGGIVDEQALINAMKNRKLLGAAIDTFTNEPVDNDAGKCFANIPNLILTPHIAGVTQESNVRVSHLIAQEVADLLTKNKLN